MKTAARNSVFFGPSFHSTNYLKSQSPAVDSGHRASRVRARHCSPLGKTCGTPVLSDILRHNGNHHRNMKKFMSFSKHFKIIFPLLLSSYFASLPAAPQHVGTCLTDRSRTNKSKTADTHGTQKWRAGKVACKSRFKCESRLQIVDCPLPCLVTGG